MSGLYPRLAAQNIKLHRRSYIPYILTGALTAAVYYILDSLAQNPDMGETASTMLTLGVNVVAIFAAIFLFYTNSFLMKQRQRELGLYNVLGMNKGHIARVIGFETLYAAIALLAGGLLTGILLDKLTFLVLANLIGMEAKYGFHISTGAVLDTLILFGVVTLLIYLSNIVRVGRSKPVELLHGSSAGEREPKTKIIMAILGVLCLGSGYVLSILSSQQAMLAVMVFFLAVLLVIIGTYFLFVAGSIAILKMLRKNKRYYYKTQHFISVSGMLYRMKQNAVGLANICILSTMVLVIISSTFSLWIGAEAQVANQCPNDVYLEYSAWDPESYGTLDAELEALVKKTPGSACTVYEFLEHTALLDGDRVTVDEASRYPQTSSLGKLAQVAMISEEMYNAIAGTSAALGADEALLFFNDRVQSAGTVEMYGKTYAVRAAEETFPIRGNISANILQSVLLVLPDFGDAALRLEDPRRVVYSFSLDMDSAAKQAFSEAVEACIANLRGENGYSYYLGRQESVAGRSAEMYGSFLFMGISLGLLFTMAAVLIIYYKQISEGYDDKARFSIMRKVGLSAKEAKRSIHAQILTVFFLPLVTAGIHMVFAFPIVRVILAALQLSQTNLFILCTAVTFVIFAVFYAIVFGLTARSYYRIVSEETA